MFILLAIEAADSRHWIRNLEADSPSIMCESIDDVAETPIDLKMVQRLYRFKITAPCPDMVGDPVWDELMLVIDRDSTKELPRIVLQSEFQPTIRPLPARLEFRMGGDESAATLRRRLVLISDEGRNWTCKLAGKEPDGIRVFPVRLSRTRESCLSAFDVEIDPLIAGGNGQSTQLAFATTDPECPSVAVPISFLSD